MQITGCNRLFIFRNLHNTLTRPLQNQKQCYLDHDLSDMYRNICIKTDNKNYSTKSEERNKPSSTVQQREIGYCDRATQQILHSENKKSEQWEVGNTQTGFSDQYECCYPLEYRMSAVPLNKST